MEKESVKFSTLLNKIEDCDTMFIESNLNKQQTSEVLDVARALEKRIVDRIKEDYLS